MKSLLIHERLHVRFMALFGIATLGTKIARLLGSHLPGCIALPASMSISAQIATLPVVAAGFGVVYPMGIITTLVISPLIVGYLWTGIVFMLSSTVLASFAWAEYVSGALLFFMQGLRRLTIYAASLAAGVPGISISGYAALVAGPLYACLFLAGRILELRKRHEFTVRLTEGARRLSQSSGSRGKKKVRSEFSG